MNRVENNIEQASLRHRRIIFLYFGSKEATGVGILRVSFVLILLLFFCLFFGGRLDLLFGDILCF